MSKEHQNKIKAGIKREIIELAEMVMNNRLLHAHFAKNNAPSETRDAELQATLMACQELRDSISKIPDTSEIAFENFSHSIPYLEFTLSKTIKGHLPVESTP